MLLALGFIVLGIFLLVAGGETLLRGAVGLATLVRLTPAVIGLTVVAAGTSVPELAVSAAAAFDDKADIAVSNVIGSNIFNIAGVLGLCALIRPLRFTGGTIWLEYPVLVLVTLLCLVIVQDGQVNRLDAVLCVAIYVGFTSYMVSLVRQQLTKVEQKEVQGEVEELTPSHTNPNLWLCIGLVIFGSLLLAGGGHFTVQGAVELARRLEVSERIIGLTIVSVGTGLPEFVATVIAIYRGRTDIAVGNVIGSNLFNILMILGISSLVSPLPVEAALIQNDSWWMMGVTLLMFPILLGGTQVKRWHGLILSSVYVAYLGFLLAKQPPAHETGVSTEPLGQIGQIRQIGQIGQIDPRGPSIKG